MEIVHFSNFRKGMCTDVSYVAGGVELTVHKESVVVSATEICVRNLFMTEIIIELSYSHTVMQLTDFE